MKTDRSFQTLGASITCVIAVATILGGGFTGARPAGAADSEPGAFPQATMRAVFNEMKVLIPLSLSEERWSDVKDRKKIGDALQRLEDLASALERHGRSREAGFGELALNLSRDLRDSGAYFRKEQFEESRFFFAGTMQSCVSCHTRLPTGESFPLATELTDQSEIERLTPAERAWLLVIVRRFDEALASWEAMIRDPEIPAAQIDSAGVLVDYLNVAIRVRRDLDRAARTLQSFAAREDIPFYLEGRLQAWRKALDGLDRKPFRLTAEPSLDLGARLAQQASDGTRGPFDRKGLIEDLAAASQLVHWLEENQARRRQQTTTRNPTKKERADLARAYCWLGVVEGRSLDGFWVTLSERHLEAAVRADPQGPLAHPAYSLLEENYVLGFGGASGDILPTDVWNLLHELRLLIGLEG